MKNRLRGFLFALLFLAAPAAAQIRGAPELAHALGKLPLTGSVLHTGAHPDDEHSSLLAYLARGRHVRTAYLSVTRGEGGQNLLGTEQYEALGLLRTEELLAARRLDGAEQFFTRAFEFGYSKSAPETFAKWGHDEVLADFVRVIRQFRPDVIVSRFSGTSQDGHGHHQAAGILAREAFQAAADPNRFPEQIREGLRPWQARKFYTTVNRFGPAADLPLPADALELELGDYDPLLGASYNQIGIEGRALHRSQAQGGFLPRPGPVRTGLQCREGSLCPGTGASEKDLFQGIAITLDRYAELGASPAAVKELKALVDETIEKFRADKPEAIIPLLARGLSMVCRLRSAAASNDEQRFLLDIKENEFVHALELAHSLSLDALTERAEIVPGSTLKVTVTAWNRARGTPLEAREINLTGPAGWKIEAGDWKPSEVAYNRSTSRAFTVTVPADAAPSQPYWLREPRKGDLFTVADYHLIGRPHSPPLLEARVRWATAGVELESKAPVLYRRLDEIWGPRYSRLNVLPAVGVWVEPATLMFPAGAEREVKVRLRNNSQGPVSGAFSLNVSEGWSVTPREQEIHLSRSGEDSACIFRVKAVRANAGAGKATVSARNSTGYQVIAYPHIRPQYWFQPAEASLQPVSVEIAPNLHVGYIMGAGDEVPASLRQLGASVTMLEADDLLTGKLAQYDAIVAGIRAYTVRRDLVAANDRLLDYARQGGVFIVQYQSGDARFPYGPFPMEQGRPAPRVSVEEAPVELLAPEHPLLSRPNRITAADFEDWVQERGLYFMGKWASEYTPLVASHDPGEPPQPGGMLVAPLGKGLYVYTAYAWFRQLPAGVPGAYRLWANLLSWAKEKGK